MKKKYTNYKDINKDLKRLNLKRQIALEEIKLIKYEIKEDLRLTNWVSSLFDVAKRYGIAYGFKRLVTKN